MGPFGLPFTVQLPVPVGSEPAKHSARSGWPKRATEIVPKMLLLLDGVSWCASTYSVLTRIFTLSAGNSCNDADPCAFWSKSRAGPSCSAPHGPFSCWNRPFTYYVTAAVAPLPAPEQLPVYA